MVIRVVAAAVHAAFGSQLPPASTTKIFFFPIAFSSRHIRSVGNRSRGSTENAQAS